MYQGIGYAAMTYAALAAGDVTAALEASDAARPILRAQPDQVTMHQVLMAQLAWQEVMRSPHDSSPTTPSMRPMGGTEWWR